MRKKILIISGEADVCLLLKAYFKRKNYYVMVAHTLEDALKEIEKDKPDFVFLDKASFSNIEWVIKELEKAIPGVQIILSDPENEEELSNFLKHLLLLE